MKQSNFTYKELLELGWKRTISHAWFILVSVVFYSLMWSAAPNNIISRIVALGIVISVVYVSLMIANDRRPDYMDLLAPFKTYKIFLSSTIATLLVIVPFIIIASILGLLFTSAYATGDPASVIGYFAIIAALMYFAIRFKFYMYVIMDDENTHPLASLRKSWEITRGKFWKIFGFWVVCVILLLILIQSALVLPPIFNIIPTLALIVIFPVIIIAFAELYKRIK